MVIQINCNQQDTQRFTGEQLRAVLDKNLTPFAEGLWMTICTLPEGTDFTLKQLQNYYAPKHAREVAEAYQELVDAGYIEE